MFEIWKDATSPVLEDTLTVGGSAVDLSTATSVKFQMRAEGSAALKVDAAASLPNGGGDGVWQYAWAASDTDTPDDYLGWLRVVFADGKIQESPEFQVKVLAHDLSSGSLCSVADVREFLSWPNDDRSKDRLIQSLILGASERLQDEAGREFAPKADAVTRRFRLVPSNSLYEGGRRLYLIDFGWRHDLRAATTVTLHPELDVALQHELSADSHYILEPQDGGTHGVYDRMKISAYGLGFDGILLDTDVLDRFGFCYLDVLGDWGFPSIPHDLNDLTRKVVASWLQRDVSSITDAVSGESSQPPVPAGFDLPLFAVRGINRFRRQVAF